MSTDDDPLLQVALRLAVGESLRMQELVDADPGRARGLCRLAEIVRRLQPPVDGMGRRWGHLQRLEPAGAGSYGEVFRAYDPTLDRCVALKLRRTDAPGAIFSGRDFVAEAQRLARVRHPHVLAVHGASYHDDRAGLWCDWIEGETLHARLRRDRRLSGDALLQLAQQLTSALVAVHGAGLVHGDLSAGNVMLDVRGHAVLMDFGAGFESDAEGTAFATGTPRYQAPEIARGGAIGAAVDLYALGVVLHLAGSGEYPPPSGAVAPAFGPRALRRLVRRMLSTEPAARPDASALLRALDAIRAAPLLRARRLALLAIVGGLIAVSVVSWQAYRRSERLRDDAEQALGRSESANRFLIDLISSAAPDALGPRATLRDLLDLAPPLIEQRYAQRAEDRMRLLELLAGLEADLGNDRAAAALFQRASQAAASLDPQGDAAMKLQVLALRWQAADGEVAAALPAAEALLARAQREDRSPALRALIEFQLAEIELRSTQQRSSPAALARVVARVERVLAQPTLLDARLQAEALRRMSALKLEQGDDIAAAALARRAVAHAGAEFGVSHPLTALNRRLLAWTLMYDDAAAAESLFRTNLQLHESKLGRRSRSVADDFVGLVWALSNQTRFDEALPLAQEAWSLGNTLLGPEHRTTIDAGLGLAEAQAGSGSPELAATTLEMLRERLRAGRGSENRQYLLATRQLALLLQSTQPARAQTLFAECLRHATEALGADSDIARECRAVE